jgi:hypothetical protein
MLSVVKSRGDGGMLYGIQIGHFVCAVGRARGPGVFSCRVLFKNVIESLRFTRNRPEIATIVVQV